MIYLDYAATAPLENEVLQAMLPYLKEHFGNPDSTHAAGRKAAYAVSGARDKVAEVLGVSPQEVYFTSGGTEADNWALQCAGEGKAAVSEIEHAAVLSASRLRKAGCISIHVTKGGLVALDSVEQAIAAGAQLVCVMAANNETGCVQPYREISALCHRNNSLYFADCVQAANALDLKELACCADVLSLSAHKIGGPKGVGALIVKKGVKLGALIAGGEQERGKRGGTLNVAGIVGFSVALERAQRERENYVSHTQALRNSFETRVLAGVKGANVDGENRLPNISHVTFPADNALLARLDLAGVCVSGGAACSAHSALPSHVMLAMGRSEGEAKRGIRFSFGRETTQEEALRAAQIVTECACAR